MHPNEAVLNELVDNTLAPADTVEVERHLENCAECRALVAGLTDLRHAIASLESREPPARAWSRIERAIQLEGSARNPERASDEGRARNVERVENVGDGRRLGAGRRWRFTWMAVAAAAVVVLAVLMASRPWRFASGPDAPADGAQAGATSGDPAQAVEAELRQASEHYEKAIKGLEQIANDGQGTLDPRTAATLQKNLAVIDQAITESRAALRTQPNSEPAQQSLIENFKTKIGLLQDTVALINEMRKGNEAGAARIVSGLKQKG
jgi:putative zinc finger protein